MTARETRIGKRILDALHALDGGQAHTLSVHADAGGMNLCSTAEFDAVLAELDRQQLVLFVDSKFKGRLWSITDAGEAARLQM